LVAAGLGIAIAVMAFAPAETSRPPSVAVGVHEANYEVLGEAESPLTYYFRVHTGVELADVDEFDSVAARISDRRYNTLVDSLLEYHGFKIRDQRAWDIIETIRVPDSTGASEQLEFSLGTEWKGSTGYWFHVFMDFEIKPPGLHKQFIRFLRLKNYGAINGILTSWIAQDRIRGPRPRAIVDAVRFRGADRETVR
jgi:hypothetical protein